MDCSSKCSFTWEPGKFKAFLTASNQFIFCERYCNQRFLLSTQGQAESGKPPWQGVNEFFIHHLLTLSLSTQAAKQGIESLISFCVRCGRGVEKNGQCSKIDWLMRRKPILRQWELIPPIQQLVSGDNSSM
jgi:hypothetical protein